MRIVKPDAGLWFMRAGKRLGYRQSDTIEVDIDKVVQEWLDLIFPSFEYFKYSLPKPEFSQYLQEKLK